MCVFRASRSQLHQYVYGDGKEDGADRGSAEGEADGEGEEAETTKKVVVALDSLPAGSITTTHNTTTLTTLPS